MAQRRRRFIATLSKNGTTCQRTVLAYNEEYARRYYERAGYEVLSVDKKPNASRAQPKPTGGGWTLDQAALDRAIEFFGLKLNVKIGTHGRNGSTRGTYSMMPTGGSVKTSGKKIYGLDTATGFFHKIQVKSYLTPEQASRTLWHELTHAMQAERTIARGGSPREIFTSWKASDRGVRYENKPKEVEARSYEDRAEKFPLAY